MPSPMESPRPLAVPVPLLVVLLVPSACAVESPGRPTRAPDPRVAVTDWSEITRFNCRPGAGGAPLHCSADPECPPGTLCDSSVGCGCCVDEPPALPPDGPLARAILTSCEAGRCAPPRGCDPSGRDDTTCTMAFDGATYVWASLPFPEAPTLAGVRRRLCIKLEPEHACLWRLDLPAGRFVVDAPLPVHYEHAYECGGRTCNGAPAVRVAPVAGRYTLTLAAGGCR